MGKEKMMCLVLLDLCAFACSQDPSDTGTRAEYEEAYHMARRYNLPELKTYRDHMETLTEN